MKVLVTGATGFIGNYVIMELLKRNVTIIATSTDEIKAQGCKWYSKVEYTPFYIKCIEKGINLFNYFHQPDVLIHLAWEGLPNYKSDFHIGENLPRHKSFIENLIQNGLNNINVAGTCFEYGFQEGELSEEMPSNPENNYAIAKDELRKYIETLTHNDRMSFKWLRLFYMYGKGQNPKSLIAQLETAIKNGDMEFNMSGGEQVRDFLPVDQVAKYIVDVCLQTNVTGIINICSNEPVTVKDFVENYLQKQNQSISLNLGVYPYPDFEPMQFWGSNKKLKFIK